MPFDGAGSAAYPTLEKIDQILDLLGSPAKWCKGSERNRAGQYCIRGAAIAVGGLELVEPAILGAIHQIAGRHFRRLEEFNDFPKTTHAQVLKVLHRARDNLVGGRVGYPVAVPAVYPRQGAFGEGWLGGMWQRCFG